MSDGPFLKKLLLACGRGPVRLFRNNNARAWVPSGEPVVARTTCQVTMHAGDVLLRRARPLHAGLAVGSGDLVGWKTVEVTPDMIGQRVAVFVSIEAKEGTGRMSPAQKDWANAVRAAGGLAAEIRSVEQAEQLLGFR